MWDLEEKAKIAARLGACQAAAWAKSGAVISHLPLYTRRAKIRIRKTAVISAARGGAQRFRQ
jgi:hypothetical protein